MKNKILEIFDVVPLYISSKKIDKDHCRLNPSFYSSNQSFINGLDTRVLNEFCIDIFNPPVFKREFVNDIDECKYLASAEISLFKTDITYITIDQADRLKLKVKKNWILVTGFGTIGNIRIVDNIINNFAVANNVTRIVPKPQFLGFIAAFLESSFGNNLLNDYSAGAVVKFIEAPQIAQIPVPILSEAIIAQINDLYLKAVACRENAAHLLTKANNLILNYNNLPPLEDSELETLDPDNETDIRLVNSDEFTEDFRLDAHYYNPTADLVVKNIQKQSVKFNSLLELTNEIIMGKRFKRNYVDSSNGTAFLSGKNIIQIRPEVKYLSNTEINFIDELLVKKNWTLITCSGTLGRTSYVYNNYENFAASQHILRIVPNEELVDPGYLYCFLSTDYGYHQIVRYKYGAVIDEIDDKNMESILVPIIDKGKQKEIGDLVRQAYDLRAKAIQMEDQAQNILTKALTEA
ncbi:MAG: restriction endonuclease subunit S [Ignavibacteriales bacterium]|nr:restriction endonuclease subunit S [Ignavibacteriales bacterium]